MAVLSYSVFSRVSMFLAAWSEAVYALQNRLLFDDREGLFMAGNHATKIAAEGGIALIQAPCCGLSVPAYKHHVVTTVVSGGAG